MYEKILVRDIRKITLKKRDRRFKDDSTDRNRIILRPNDKENLLKFIQT